MSEVQSEVLTRQQVEDLHVIAAKHGVREVKVFGSRARGDARPGSDIDLLVEIEYGRGVAMRLVRFYREVRELLGVEVDVLTEDALDRRLHARILREARPI